MQKFHRAIMKTALVATLAFGGQAFANDLVGQWVCTSSTPANDAGISTYNTHNVIYHANGTAKESIKIEHFMGAALYRTDNIKVNYEWQLLGGRQQTVNLQIESFDILDNITQKYVPQEHVAPLKQSLIDDNIQNAWQTVSFIDNNTYAYNFETGQNGICRRQ